MMTPGSSAPAMYERPSCIRLSPGPEDAVITRAPAAAAPYTMLMAATSLSACTNVPPTCGMYNAAASVTSLAGVMGYPKNERHPARIAPLMMATLPLQSCRMGAPLRQASRFCRRRQPVYRDRSGLGTAVEANSAARAPFARVVRRMNPVRVQSRQQFQALRRAGVDAQAAPLALIRADGDIASCLSHIHLAAALSFACGRCSHFVCSQYSYNSSRNLGCAISINDLARSRIDLPCRYATPYSVTT